MCFNLLMCRKYYARLSLKDFLYNLCRFISIYTFMSYEALVVKEKVKKKWLEKQLFMLCKEY